MAASASRIRARTRSVRVSDGGLDGDSGERENESDIRGLLVAGRASIPEWVEGI